MRLVFILAFLIPGPAFAHFGHLGEIAGHSHWLGLAALGAAAAIAIWAGKSDEEPDEEIEEAEEEVQEA